MVDTAGQISTTSIVTRALRRFGAISIEDQEVSKHWLQEGAEWFDILVRNLTGTSRTAWLIQNTIEIPLVAGYADYSLVPTALSAQKNQILQANNTGGALKVNSIPDEGIQFPMRASIYSRLSPTPSERDVTLYRRWEFDEIPNKGASGIPHGIFIDRSMEPVMTTWPIVPDNDHVLKLVFQSFAPTASRLSNQSPMRLRTAWEYWAVLALAYELSSGPIKRIPIGERKEIKDDRDKAKDALLAFENDDHYRPRISKSSE